MDGHTVPVAANFYGDSKLQADVAVRDLADDKFKVIVIRPPMIYGKIVRVTIQPWQNWQRNFRYFQM